jgi:undecaprenyl-diphosphatase
MSFLRWADSIDKQLFTFIHHSIANPLVWIPLYAFLLFWVLRYHLAHAIKFILLSAATVAFTDYVSASVLKEFFKRSRPCHAPELQPIIRNILDCGGMYGFPSSHASNHFGMAAFWFGAVLYMTGKKWHWVWFWAGLICFAQVYVGKHYPFDVLCGAILGLAAGTVSAKIFARWASPQKPTEGPGNFADQKVILS